MRSKDDVVKGLRTLLAEGGYEKTPEEAEALLESVQRLYDTVDAEVYEGMASMTPGHLAVTAMKYHLSIAEMLTVRNIIMYVYEHGHLGLEDVPWEHPLAEPESDLRFFDPDSED